MFWTRLGHGLAAGAAVDRENRLAGLGPLAGIATGTAVGVTAAFTWPALARIPAALGAGLLGALAMAGSDGPLVALGLTQPRDWAAADWASDRRGVSSPALGRGGRMSETPQEAQAGVADALRDLSDNSRALVRHEIAAAQKETLGKAKQALPAAGLLAAAAFFGVLSAAACFRLSIRLLEKSLPPAAAAFTAAAGYGVAAGAAGAVGMQRLRAVQPLFPAETARETVKTVADTTAQAASR